MNRMFVGSVVLAVLLALGGCCWPGYGHHHGPGQSRYYDRSYDTYDQYRQGGPYYRRR
ncbi:MAG: hypothetical protein LBD10_14295 [Desulfobulbus sp.]|jgi:hypothetical protein|uniref:hypothetical protein n=1 Tax=Desulfobulbus sp. TaxID=895 RepID=UPI00283F1FD7|nr:hypothetical protein [Desulfobulbus sp.]MDR2551361.1 hypothetical protein [Desulfobulbus sp.]